MIIPGLNIAPTNVDDILPKPLVMKKVEPTLFGSVLGIKIGIDYDLPHGTAEMRDERGRVLMVIKGI